MSSYAIIEGGLLDGRIFDNPRQALRALKKKAKESGEDISATMRVVTEREWHVWADQDGKAGKERAESA